MTINGYSQGGPTNTVILIQLNLNGNNGLVFNPGSGNSTVQGLSIYSGVQCDRDRHQQRDGRRELPGGPGRWDDAEFQHYGVLIFGSNNTISGANIIGANGSGIDITGSGATGNVVLGNFIGTNASGANLGNTGDGVLIDSGASNNTIGPANTIGLNGNGIDIAGPAQPATWCWATSSAPTPAVPTWATPATAC